MSPTIGGLAAGLAAALLLLRFPLRNWKWTWWGNVCYAMVFCTAGPAIANGIHAGTMKGRWDELILAALLLVPTYLGARRG
jgi:hypothetical protein